MKSMKVSQDLVFSMFSVVKKSRKP